MSKILERKILCPDCKLMSRQNIYPTINAKNSIEQKNALLDGSLFLWQCPHCKAMFNLQYPVLYHDPDQQLLIYYSPEAKYNSISDNHILDEFEQLKNFTKRVVSSLNDLKEKILIFNNELNDMYIEVAKLTLSELLEKQTNNKIIDSKFCIFDEKTSSLGFAFFARGKEEPFLKNVKIDAYDKAAEIVDEYLSKINLNDGFIKIDKNWAKEVMELEFSWE